MAKNRKSKSKGKSKKRIIIIAILATLLLGSGSAYLGGSWYLRYRAQGWKRDGIAASRAGDDAKASQLLLRYLRRHPGDIEALTYYVASRERAPMADGQQYAETIAALKLLIEHRPDNIDDRIHLLELYVKLERRPEALDTANALLAKAPNNARALEVKTQLLTEMGRAREGLETADHWVAIAPDQLSPHLARLSLEGQLQRPPAEIIAEAVKLRESHPGNADFEVLQGFACAHAGDDEQAGHWFKTAAGHADLSPETAKILVAQLDGEGLSDDALGVLEHLVKKNGNNDELRRSLAQRLWELQRWQDTVDALQPLRASDPKADPNLLAFKCMSLASLKHIEEAKPYRKAITDSTDPVAIAWALLLQRMMDGTDVDDRKLVTACQTALGTDRQNSYLAFFLGEADVRQGELDLAIDAFRRSVMLNGSWNLPALHLVDCLLQKRKPEEAVQVAIYCAHRHPNDKDSAITLARAWAAGIGSGGVGSSEGLLKLVTDVQKQMPGEDRTLLIEIQLLAERKKTDQAIRAARSAIWRNPPPREDVFRIVALLSRKYSLGLEAECYKQWEKAAGITPALALAKAMDQFHAGHADAGLSVFDAMLQQSDKSNEMGWKMAHASYLDLIGNPGAKEAWVTLRDRYPNEMVVQEAAANTRCCQGDWQFLQPVIDNLHKLTGDDGVAWRMASASLMIQCPRGDDDFEKGSVELNKLIQQHPTLVEPHVLLAMALVHMKRLDGAIEHLSFASRLDPNSVSISLQLAGLLQSKGDFERVEQELDRIRPELHTAAQRRQAALLLSQQNDPNHAIDLLLNVVQPSTTTAPVLAPVDIAKMDNTDSLLLATLYRQQHETAKADALVRKLMEHPDLPAIQFASALFLEEGLTTDAESALHRLDELKLEPGAKDLAWGWYYSHTGDLKNAIVSFSRATTAAPTQPAGWRELAIAQMSDHQKDAAMQTLRQASDAIPNDKNFAELKDHAEMLGEIGADPKLMPVVIDVLQSPVGREPLLELLQLSLDEHHTRDMEHFAAALQNLCERHAESLVCQIQLVQCYLDMGRLDPAMNAAQRLMSAFPKDPDPARVAVLVCKTAQRWREMESAAQKWKERQPEAAEAADCAIALAELPQQHYSAALDRVQPYVARAKADPDRHVDILSTYAIASVATGDPAAASDALWPLTARSADWRRIWIYAALQLPDGTTAAEWLDRVSGIIPPDAISERVGLGEAYDRLGRRSHDPILISSASRICGDAGNNPNADATALIAAAGQAERTERLVDAEAFYRHALKLDPSLWVAQNNLAMLLLNRGGDLNEAAQFAQAAVNNHPQDPELLDTLACIRAKGGKIREAIECMRTAVKVQPDNALWRIRLGKYLLADGDRAGASQTVAEIDADFPDLHRQIGKPTLAQEELALLRKSIAQETGKT